MGVSEQGTEDNIWIKEKGSKTNEIWGFHRSDDNDDVLLGLGAMWTGW
jgi:hypothetical protein